MTIDVTKPYPLPEFNTLEGALRWARDVHRVLTEGDSLFPSQLQKELVDSLEFTEDHGLLSGLADDDHTQYILHSLADAASDFLVASGNDVIVKKTLAETGAILEADINHDNLVDFASNEHINWTNASSNFKTSGTFIVRDPVIDIRSYLAIGDDSTDNTTAFANAITALSSGGTIFLPRGIFQTGNLTWASDIYLVGQGWSSVIKLKASEDNELVNGTSLDNIGFINLAIDGNKSNQAVAANLLELISCTNIKINRCYIHDGKKDAVYLSDCEDSWITKNRIKDNDRNGVSLGSHTNASLRIHINSNHVEGHNGSGDIGISLEPAADCEVIGNILIDNYNQITVVGVTGKEDTVNNIIKANRIIGNTNNFGIIVRGTSDTTDDNTVEGNIIDGNFLYSIYIDTAHYTEVIGNKVKPSATASSSGILVEDSDYCVVNSNGVRGQQYYGIQMLGSDHYTLNGNMVYDNSKEDDNVRDGIRLENSDEGVACGNRSVGANQKYGIGESGTSDENFIHGNHVRGNQTGGTNVTGANTVASDNHT